MFVVYALVPINHYSQGNKLIPAKFITSHILVYCENQKIINLNEIPNLEIILVHPLPIYNYLSIDDSDPFSQALSHLFPPAITCSLNPGCEKTYLIPDWIVKTLQALSIAPKCSHRQSVSFDQICMTIGVMSILANNNPKQQVCEWCIGLPLLTIFAYFLFFWIDFPQYLLELGNFVGRTHAPFGFKLAPQVDLLFSSFLFSFLNVYLVIFLPILVWSCLIVSLTVFFANLLFYKKPLVQIYCSLLFDYLTISTLFLAILHRVISKILKFQLLLLYSFGLLLRGKKINVLRQNRIDSIKTDLALLMMGTFIGFFLFFTLQTTLTYHVVVFLPYSFALGLQISLLILYRLLFLFSAKKQAKPFLVYQEERNLQWTLTWVQIPLSFQIQIGQWLNTLWLRRCETRWLLQLPTVPPPSVKELNCGFI